MGHGEKKKINLDSRLRGNDMMGGRPDGNDAETGRNGEAESTVRCQWSVVRCCNCRFQYSDFRSINSDT